MKLNENQTNLINQFQILNQQVQNVLLQKDATRLQILECEKAGEEMEKTKSKSGYKISGSVMIEREVDELKKEITDRKSDLENRSKLLEITEQRLIKRLKEMEPEIKKLI